jgi:hypothetical protein
MSDTDDAPQNWDSLGRERLQIERARLEIEKRSESKAEPVFYKYWLPFMSVFLSATIAAIVTISIALAANRLSSNQMEIADKQQKSQLQQAREQQDRQWKLDAGRFVLEHQKTILSGSKEQRERFARIAGVAFPKEITEAMLTKIGNTDPNKASQQQWRDIREQLVPKLPEESVHVDASVTAEVNSRDSQLRSQDKTVGSISAAISCPTGPLDISRAPIELHRECKITGVIEFLQTLSPNPA